MNKFYLLCIGVVSIISTSFGSRNVTKTIEAPIKQIDPKSYIELKSVYSETLRLDSLLLELSKVE